MPFRKKINCAVVLGGFEYIPKKVLQKDNYKSIAKTFSFIKEYTV